MPIYPDKAEVDYSQPLDLSGLKFSAGTEFGTALGNTVQHEISDPIIANTARVTKLFGPEAGEVAGGLQYFPNPEKRQPLSVEEINKLTEDRPDLKIPVGAPRLVGELMQSLHDNDKNFGLVSQHPASLWGSVGAFGGSFLGAALSPASLVPGGLAAKAAKSAYASIALKGLSEMGAPQIYGSAAARVGTLIGQAAAEGAGFGIGAQLEQESSTKDIMQYGGESYSYIEGLQRVGESALFGAFMGGAAKSIGVGLMGRRIIDHPKHGVIDIELLNEVPEGAEVRREGGLLNRPEFKNIPIKAKEYVTKNFKPWSKKADTTMKEEATGQMLNGQQVNVDIIMKQGMVDAGSEFREAAIRNPEINVQELDSSLEAAQDNIELEIDAISGKKFQMEPEEPVGVLSEIDAPATDTPILSDVPLKAQQEAFNIAKQEKIDELNNQFMLAQSLRDHINDTHEPLTQEEVQAYSGHLQEPGMFNNGYKSEVPEESKSFTVDNYLEEFPEVQTKELMEILKKDKDFIKEIERTDRRMKQQKTYAKMVKSMTDCILKGGAR